MANNSLNCIYCGAGNPAGSSRCVSCGAPLDLPAVPPTRVTVVDTPAKDMRAPAPSQSNTSSQSVTPPRPDTTPEQIRDALDAAPISDQLKEGLLAAGAGIGSLGIGSFFARTAAEAGSIAFSAFLLGVFSAITRNSLVGLFGGMLVGLMVGLVIKRPLAVLFSAPLGTTAGLAAGYYLQSSLAGWPLPLLLGMAGGALLAVLGGRRGSMTGAAKWYSRLRPLLGMTGGFLFALLGFAVGGLIR